MQARTSRLLVLVAGSAVVAGALLAAACSSSGSSSSSGGPPTPPLPDAGRTDAPRTEPTEGGSEGGKEAGADADCSKAPKLHDNTAGFFCPFTSKDAGPDSGTCSANEICCSPGIPTGSDAGFPPAYCAPITKADPNDTRDSVCGAAAASESSTWEPGNRFNSMWECADRKNCPSGNVCCIVTAPDAGGVANIGPNQDKEDIPVACNALQVFKSNGTKCRTACAAGSELRTCSLSDPTCPEASTCTPIAGSASSKSSTRDLGYCKPN